MKKRDSFINDKKITAEKIQEKLLKKGFWRIFIVIFLGILLSGLALSIDLNCLKHWERFGCWRLERAGGKFDCFRKVLKEGASSFYDLSVTLGTILAAVLVFYYSMQDSRREGIPRRTITAYKYGKLTIPVLFFWQIICLFGITALLVFDLTNWLYVGLLYISIIQIWIMWVIVRTSIFDRNCKIIYQTEKRQFILLLKYSNIIDRQYIWSYLIHHMEQVMAGDGILFERMEIIQKLLGIPDDVKEKCIDRNQATRLKRRWQRITHEYFFCNLTAVIARLQPESENAFLNVLLQFLSEKGRKMEKENRAKEEGKAGESRAEWDISTETDCLMIVAVVMFSVVYSGLERADVFCVHALNEVQVSEKFRSRLLFLYLLLLEFVYRIGYDRLPIPDFKDIRDFDQTWNQEMDEMEIHGYYFRYWMAWSLETSIPVVRSLCYYRNAVEALLGKGKRSMLMSCVYLYERNKGRQKCESEF